MRLIDADALEKDLRNEYEQAYQKFHAAKREDEKTEYGAGECDVVAGDFPRERRAQL